MAKLTIRDLASVDIDLWGKAFESVPPVRSVYKRIQELEQQLLAISDDDPDAQVRLTAEIIDLRLKPAGQGRKKASELIVEKWQADEITLGQLLDFVSAIGDADRPT
jgi:hypothetical protein